MNLGSAEEDLVHAVCGLARRQIIVRRRAAGRSVQAGVWEEPEVRDDTASRMMLREEDEGLAPAAEAQAQATLAASAAEGEATLPPRLLRRERQVLLAEEEDTGFLPMPRE